jgi:N-acetylneuraminic acid mutarotase
MSFKMPKLAVACFSIAIPFSFARPSYPHSSYPHHHLPEWTPLASIPSPRQEHTTFFLPPSTIGILGGVAPARGAEVATTNITQFYSISDNTWRTVAPLPKPINHVNAAVSGGKVYVLGGLVDTNNGVRAWSGIADSWVFDPVTDVWSALPPMPAEEARGSAAMGVYDGKIILAGGMRVLELQGRYLQDTVSTVSIFDTVDGKWLEVPAAAKNIPEARDHAGAAVVGDKFYILGGRDHGQVNVKDTVFVLDLHNISVGWRTSEGRMPTPRGGVAAASVGSKIYTFGGEGNRELESGVYNETEVFDTVSETWDRLAPMKIPRHGTYAVGVEGRVYIPGGGTLQGGNPVADFDVFSP